MGDAIHQKMDTCLNMHGFIFYSVSFTSKQGADDACHPDSVWIFMQLIYQWLLKKKTQAPDSRNTNKNTRQVCMCVIFVWEQWKIIALRRFEI